MPNVNLLAEVTGGFYVIFDQKKSITGLLFVIFTLTEARLPCVIPGHVVWTHHGVWFALLAVNVASVVSRIFKQSLGLKTTY